MRSSWNRQHENLPVPDGFRRFKLTLSYDGSSFFGWQSQRREGVPDNSVQGHIETAVSVISGERVTVYGSGRTDSGVHALGQVCHFDSSAIRMEADKLRLALNANLPHGIRIGEVEERFDAFHARYSTLLREYEYVIKADPEFNAFDYGRVWRIPRFPDADVLRSLARRIVGEDIDFSAFDFSPALPEHSGKRDVLVSEFSMSASGALTYRIVGNAFLYHMVRALVGTFVKMAIRFDGDPAAAVSEFDLLLGGGSGNAAFVAPACGLYLKRIIYDEAEYAKLRNEAISLKSDGKV